MRHTRQWGARVAIGLVLVVAIAACGGDGDREPGGPRITPTITPVIPTWTPSAIPPSWTPVQRTPAPSITPRPSDTPVPAPRTGSAEIEGELAVTLLEADANAAIAAAFPALDSPALSAAPQVTFGTLARVTIRLQHTNALLEQSGEVIARGQLQLEAGGLRFIERVTDRQQSGVLPSETTLQAAYALVERALTEAIRVQLDPAGQARAWTRVVVYPGYLRVFLAAPAPAP